MSFKNLNAAIWVSFVVAFLSLPSISSGQVIEENPRQMEGIDVREHLGEYIPMDLQFVDDAGDTVTLDKYFTGDKPVMMVMVYYTCPMLCNLVLNGLTSTLREVDMNPGEDYRFIAISIDPRETAELAAAKKKNYLGSLGREGADSGWVFHVGTEDQSEALADALGFEYYWDDDKEQYAHPAVAFLLSPDGKISRYLYGINFEERDVRLGLIEASEGKVGSTFDKLILYCFHYDPDAGGYVAFAGNIMKLGGFLTLILLGAVLLVLWRRERNKRSESTAAVGSAA